MHNCNGILLCTDTEENVHSFIKDASIEDREYIEKYLLRVKQKDIESMDSIDTIYITDCIRVKRLGILSALLNKAKNIVIYEHHPIDDIDIKNSAIVYKPVGACVTVVVHKLLSANLDITPFDATLYLMGIYEDTGMLTYPNTSPEDIRTVASLMELGGTINLINRYIKREFTREQIFILNELLMNLSSIVVDGVHVHYAYASVDEYLDNLAVLNQRILEIEQLTSLFILVRCGVSIVIIGRSQGNSINIGKILSVFNGGGHFNAGSANIKDLELFEAIDILKITIRNHLKPLKFLYEIMSSPAKSLDQDTTLKESLNYMLLHNLNHLPVVNKHRIANEGSSETVGIISRKDVMQAIKHGFGDEPISIFMEVEFDIFSPFDSFSKAEGAIIGGNRKLLPVEKDGKLVGVLTRTDILSLMYEVSIHRKSFEEKAKVRLGFSKSLDIKSILKNNLPDTLYKDLLLISSIGASEGISVYIVGGFVRDLLLGKVNNDIDIVAESDAVRLAISYAKSMDARTTIHDHYKTATVISSSGYKIDFATARTEYYQKPGAAPVVQAGSIRSDLMRRDFTINAMAIRIDGNNFGNIIDFFGGQRDIVEKKIRVLHSLSFVDDPTRVFRAIRFAARLDFTLGEHTLRLLKYVESNSIFTAIRGSKLFIEIKYILSEDSYRASLSMLKKYNMLRVISSNLHLNDLKDERFILLEELFLLFKEKKLGNITIWQVRLMVLLSEFNYKELKNILRQLNVETTVVEILLLMHNRVSSCVKKVRSCKGNMKASSIYRLLSPLYSTDLLFLAAQLGKDNYSIVTDYICYYKDMRTYLNGNDLINMGISPSKELGNILKDLLYAKLDGVVGSKEEEKIYVFSKFKQPKDN